MKIDIKRIEKLHSEDKLRVIKLDKEADYLIVLTQESGLNEAEADGIIQLLEKNGIKVMGLMVKGNVEESVGLFKVNR